MTLESRDLGTPGVPEVPLPRGADPTSKRLIAAILAAGQDGCKCTACQLLRKMGSDISKHMLDDDNKSVGGG